MRKDRNALQLALTITRFADTAIIYALAALMAYDYVLTVHREAVTIWPKKKRSGPAWLFIANRYLLILSTVLACSPIPNAHSCNGTIRLGQAVNIAQDLVIAGAQFSCVEETKSDHLRPAFAALRVYAFWNRNIPCSLLVLALGLVPVATNSVSRSVPQEGCRLIGFSVRTRPVYSTILQGPDPWELLFGQHHNISKPILQVCGPIPGAPDETHKATHRRMYILVQPKLMVTVWPTVLLTTRASAIAMDTCVLFVTWWKTWHTYRFSRRAGVQAPLSYLILRDGERIVRRWNSLADSVSRRRDGIFHVGTQKNATAREAHQGIVRCSL